MDFHEIDLPVVVKENPDLRPGSKKKVSLCIVYQGLELWLSRPDSMWFTRRPQFACRWWSESDAMIDWGNLAWKFQRGLLPVRVDD